MCFLATRAALIIDLKIVFLIALNFTSLFNLCCEPFRPSSPFDIFKASAVSSLICSPSIGFKPTSPVNKINSGK